MIRESIAMQPPSSIHSAMPCTPPLPSSEIAIDWHEVIFNMLTLKGIYGRQMYETWYKMTILLQSGLDIRPVITHRFSYKDFQDAFHVMRSGNSGKVILNWEELARD